MDEKNSYRNVDKGSFYFSEGGTYGLIDTIEI